MNDCQIIRHLQNGGIVGFRLHAPDDALSIHAQLDELGREMGATIWHMRHPGPIDAIQAWIEEAYPDPPVDAGFVWADGDGDNEYPT